jgi:hypothetical protein
MASFILAVDAQIANLRGFKDDLDELFWGLDDRNGPTASALSVAIAEVDRRAAVLEAGMRRLGSETVLLPDLAAEDARSLERALVLLDGELDVGAQSPAPKLWARIRQLLAAADDLILATSRATATSAETEAPTSAVVIPFARSRG